MKKKKLDKNTKSLLEAIKGIDSTKEAECFFRDLCTVEELRSMSERWQIAKLLDEGLSYRKIAESVGASTTTVTRVSNWLVNGEGGYRAMLDKNKSHHNSSKVFRKS